MDQRPKFDEMPPTLTESIPLLDEDWDRMDFDATDLGAGYDLATQMD